MPNEERRLPSLGWIHAVGATVLIGALALVYFAIDRSPPIRFLDGAVSPIEVAAGEPLTVTRSIEWVRFDCTNVVSGYIQDATGVQDKQAHFSAPTPDKDRCIKDTAERDRAAGVTREQPACIVNSRSAPPQRGIKTANGSGSRTAPGIASYHATVNLECGFLGRFMEPIRVVAPPLTFTVK